MSIPSPHLQPSPLQRNPRLEWFACAGILLLFSTSTCGVSGTVGSSRQTPPVITTPVAPTNLVAAAGNGQVVLTWNASTSAAAYHVKRSTTSRGAYAEVSETTATTYTDAGLVNGTTYYFVVTATNAAGESESSPEASATPSAVVRVPAAPSGLVATAGNGQVVLTWNVSTNATAYHVKRATTSGGAYTEVSAPTGTTYTDTGLANGTTYYFVVTATNGAGESGNSAEAAATPALPPVGAWSPISWSNEQPGGYDSDVYRWLDSSKQQRTAVLTRNDAADPGGSHGGMLRQFRYFLPNGAERVITGTGSNGWNGWGYLVNHVSGGAVLSADVTGSYRSAFVGSHHAIHEFRWTIRPYNVAVSATVHWFMATGRDFPLFAVTYDTSAAGAGGFSSAQTIDSRSPYGDMQFGGDGTNPYVDGVGWGDKYQFFTRDEPETPQSRWDYSQPNVVPYVKMWINNPDAEMGIVQTQSWLQHNTGGSWFTANWGRTSDNPVDAGNDFQGWSGPWTMPTGWQWPYQLNQYELMDDSSSTRSKRLAWGLPYGAVGRTSYDGYGSESTYSGHPYQSYSVYGVIGRHSTNDVMGQVSQVRSQLTSTLTITTGQIVSQGPGGVGRTDSVAYPVSGYNPTYGAYELRANASNAFGLTLNTGSGSIINPIFIVRGITGIPSQIVLDQTALVADQGYFASLDGSSSTLWLTVNTTWTGSRTLSAAP